MIKIFKILGAIVLGLLFIASFPILTLLMLIHLLYLMGDTIIEMVKDRLNESN